MEVFGSIIGLCIALCVAGWTFEDARKRGMDGASAAVWALGVAFLLIVFLPLYLLRRPALSAPSAGSLALAQQLVQLEELRSRGTLSDQAFEEAKSRLLGSQPTGEFGKDYVQQSSAYINALLQQGRKVEALAAALQLQTKLTDRAEYAAELGNVQSAIRALSGPATSPSPAPSGGRVLGGLILVVGGLLVIGALNMDVSVAVPTQTILGETFGGGRVNNIGLMNDRQNLMMLGSALGIGGLLLTLLGGGRRSPGA